MKITELQSIKQLMDEDEILDPEPDFNFEYHEQIRRDVWVRYKDGNDRIRHNIRFFKPHCDLNGYEDIRTFARLVAWRTAIEILVKLKGELKNERNLTNHDAYITEIIMRYVYWEVKIDFEDWIGGRV